jgi:hypothetical protein
VADWVNAYGGYITGDIEFLYSLSQTVGNTAFASPCNVADNEASTLGNLPRIPDDQINANLQTAIGAMHNVFQQCGPGTVSAALTDLDAVSSELRLG